MIFLLLDILIYNFTSYNSYFFLIYICLYNKNEYIKVIFIGLLLDFILLNTQFINTLILLLVFIINKRFFKFKKKTLLSYLLVTNFNFVLYNLLLAIIYDFNLTSFSNSFLINTLFVLLSYNLVKKHIKLSR